MALFDFTSMFAAGFASHVMEKNQKQLLLGLVGDGLLEPFWPTGTGIARGFLGGLDAVWMMRQVGYWVILFPALVSVSNTCSGLPET